MFKCPFKKELEEGSMVCDGLYAHVNPKEVKECPTNMFNQCQEEVSDITLVNSNGIYGLYSNELYVCYLTDNYCNNHGDCNNCSLFPDISI